MTENFTPRVMNNLGIGFEVLRSVRPSIILLSMPAFGLSGPYSDFPGIGGTIEPMSGNSWLLGESPGQPQVSGVMYPDAVAGLNGAAAVLAALQHREATGEGVHMEVSQHESMIAMLGEFFAQDAAVESFAYRNSDLAYPLNAIFAALGQEDWITVTARNNEELCVLAGDRWGYAPSRMMPSAPTRLKPQQPSGSNPARLMKLNGA
ncbi:MAG: CoA transferase [Dehalococcoidia bacterium]|nr:CoA transferase [Dehalococcoidia bacterium]